MGIQTCKSDRKHDVIKKYIPSEMGNPPPLNEIKVIHIPDNEGGELETRHHLVIISKKFPRDEECSNQK